MKLTINPFALVAKHDSVYSFIGIGASDAKSFTWDEDQRKVFIDLCSGSFFEEEALRECFGDEAVQQMCEQNWLISELPDTVSMDSRTTAFYRQYGMAGAEQQLRQKSVLILGCGGIGTHMAWHMVLLGVGRITLVDFDDVEESNLNRQLLFDRRDIGRSKVEVLREKLLYIRPDADIRVVNLRIDSKETLEKLCTAEHYDLIIKSLDSPAEFPAWLDEVCKKHCLPYTAGITLRERALIGPTFLPGKSEIGWSDILPVRGEAEKVHGIAPSFGPMLYHIADELAVECFKLLTGNGTLQYIGQIVSENIFTGEKDLLAGKPSEESAQKSGYFNTGAHFLALGLLCIGGFFHPLLFIPAFVYAIVAPVLLGEKSVQLTLVDTLIIGLLGFVRLARSGITGSAPQIAVSLVLVFCGISIMVLAACGISAFLIKKHKLADIA